MVSTSCTRPVRAASAVSRSIGPAWRSGHGAGRLRCAARQPFGAGRVPAPRPSVMSPPPWWSPGMVARSRSRPQPVRPPDSPASSTHPRAGHVRARPAVPRPGSAAAPARVQGRSASRGHVHAERVYGRGQSTTSRRIERRRTSRRTGHRRADNPWRQCRTAKQCSYPFNGPRVARRGGQEAVTGAGHGSRARRVPDLVLPWRSTPASENVRPATAPASRPDDVPGDAA
jgi:hypothetical protein